MAEDITAQLLQFLRTTFASRIPPGTALGPTTPLLSSRLIDSMGVVELFACIEQTFGISLELTIEELTQLDTAAKLARHIASLQETASGS